jgi:hypothetical protein
VVRFGPQESAVLEYILHPNLHHSTTMPVAGFQQRMQIIVITSLSRFCSQQKFVRQQICKNKFGERPSIISSGNLVLRARTET